MAETLAVGSRPARPDGDAKVRGRAIYVDDIPIPGLWHGVTVRCPVPRARILKVDTALAAQIPGVVVATARDLPGPNVLRLIVDDWPVLCEEEVRHAYEAVALVAASTREAALDAASLVRIEAEPLPFVGSLEQARLEGAKVLASCQIEKGDAVAALAAAVRVIEGEYETGHQEHIYIETQGMIAIPHEDGSLEIRGSMQCPYYVHKALAHLFADRAIRVRQTTTGGGFGGKEDYPDMVAAHAAILALKAKRPVKIVYDRHEDIVATTKRHPSWIRHRTAVDADGRFVAMDIDVVLDGGAYTTLSPVVLSRAVLHAAGPYRCEHVRIRGRVLATNTATNGAFRGFGAPQSAFAIERQVDRIARELRIDPLALRLKNCYREGDTTPTGQVLRDSVSARLCLEVAAKKTRFVERWTKLEKARVTRSDDGQPWRGIGLSLVWHGSGFTGNGEQKMKARVLVRLAPGGRVEVLVSSTDFGQGTTTVLAQIVADAVGIPLRSVEVAEVDTAFVPDSGPTVASRTVMVVGSLLEKAARELGRRLCVSVEETEGCSGVTLDQGWLRDASGRELGSFGALGDDYLAERGSLEVEEVFVQYDAEHTFDEKTYRGSAYPAYGWGCDVVEVEVDPDTLDVKPLAATMVCDVGRAIHPDLCRGQIEGGTLQAIAWGYLEEIVVDSGRYRNDRLQTYIIPTSLDTPAMETVLIENPTRFGPFGAKGVGELPMDGGAPAVVAAIENATGIRVARIPASPEHLFATEKAHGVVAAHGVRL